MLVHILPNGLKEVHIHSCLHEECEDELIAAVIRRLRFSPGLQKLHLLSTSPARNIQTRTLSALPDTLPSLRHLEGIILPPHLTNDQGVLDALAPLPALAAMESGCDDSEHGFPPSKEIKLDQYGFCSLFRVQMVATAETVRSLFQNQTSLTITSLNLSISFDLGHSVGQEQEIMDLLSTYCPAVEEFCVRSICNHCQWGMNDIAPLFRWTNLTSLRIWTPSPVNFTDGDYGTIARSFRALRSLFISPNPEHLGGVPPATLNALAEIARERPNINYVAIYINTNPTYISASTNLPKFVDHVEIYFGVSRIVDPLAIAMFLLRLSSDQLLDVDGDDEDSADSDENTDGGYAQVTKIIGQLAVFTQSLRDRIAELEQPLHN